MYSSSACHQASWPSWWSFPYNLDTKRYSLGLLWGFFVFVFCFVLFFKGWRPSFKCLISTYVIWHGFEWAITQRIIPKWLLDCIFSYCFSWQTSGYRLYQASFGQKHVCFSCQLFDWFLSRFLQGSHMVISACFLDCFCGRIPGLLDECFRIYSYWEGFSFLPFSFISDSIFNSGVLPVSFLKLIWFLVILLYMAHMFGELFILLWRLIKAISEVPRLCWF